MKFDVFNLVRLRYGAHQTFFYKLLPQNSPDIIFITMPCVVQPGRISLLMRVRYTAHHKLGLFVVAKRLQEEEGWSIHRAAECLGIAHSLFMKWMKQQSDEINPNLAMIKSKMLARLAS